MRLMQKNRDSDEHEGIQRCDRRAGLSPDSCDEDKTILPTFGKSLWFTVSSIKFLPLRMDRLRVECQNR